VKNQSLPVSSGAILIKDGRKYCVRRVIDMTDIEVIDVESGELQKRPVYDFGAGVQIEKLTPRVDLAIMENEDWEIALKRYRVIAPLLELPSRTKEHVQKAAKHADVNVATIYRWIERFEAVGTVSSLLRKERADQGNPRTDHQAEEIINKVIRDVYLNEQSVSVTRSYREVLRQCRKIGIPAPHLSTFRRRIANIAPSTTAANREGKKAARRFNAIRGSFPGADYPYAVLQIDHTMVDIILVDETHRLPIQRPFITIAIDVFSRMVAGYYISFDPPGTLATAMCIANAILPKEKPLSDLGASYPWPCSGLPTTIHVDNAKEFRGNALKMACQEYGINLEFRPVKRPEYGGHIERLMGTFMTEIHALPGTTRSRSSDLGEYNPEKKSAMTLREFEAWFANLALGAYHHKKHGEISMPPIAKYEAGILGDGDQPGIGILPMPTNEEKLRIDFLPYEERTIQPYGIALDGIFYQADVLARWIGAKAVESVRSKRKFIVRRDPRDISHILFYDPEVRQYFRIPYQNPLFPAISLWELRAIQRYLNSQGRKAENQDLIFAAFDEMQRIEDAARTKTKQVRIAQAKRDQRKMNGDKRPLTSNAEKEMPKLTLLNISMDLKPFDEIEDL